MRAVSMSEVSILLSHSSVVLTERAANIRRIGDAI
jgi:hypothetical protein